MIGTPLVVLFKAQERAALRLGDLTGVDVVDSELGLDAAQYSALVQIRGTLSVVPRAKRIGGRSGR